MRAVPSAHPEALRIVVSPDGDDAAEGTARAPIRSLDEAQRRVRDRSGDHGVVVELAGGTWPLERPLRFEAADGGTPGAPVVWTSAPGARAVLSGGVAVSGWRVHDEEAGIYRAHVPEVRDTRQLYVDGRGAERPSLPIDRNQIAIDEDGIVLRDPALFFLADLPGAERMEVHCLGSFTHRISPVARVAEGRIVMSQPAWDNNTWGYDTLAHPFDGGRLSLCGVDALMAPGQWAFDPATRELSYRAEPGDHPDRHEIIVPRHEHLLEIAGSLDEPVHDLVFTGLRFSHTSWLQPSTSVGYASQQTGTFLDRAYPRPADALTTCQNGCPAFEATRADWQQMPAAVRLAAAHRVDVEDCVFTCLGQTALGIGNDAATYTGGAGWAVTDVIVRGNEFFEVSGGAIVVGGVAADAHHPSDERMTVRDIVIDDNLVTRVATDYRENAGILATYVDGVVITRNELSHLPYDGIDVGYGWGAHDPGGSADYAERGLYAFQPVYETPTTLRGSVVTHNLIHHTKTSFHDGGALYTLSSAPGTRIAENHVYANGGSVGVYLDEGSSDILVERNVVQDTPVWAFTNTYRGARTDRNTFRGNWNDGGRTHAPEAAAHGNRFVDNVVVLDGEWPEEARRVMAEAGRRRRD